MGHLQEKFDKEENWVSVANFAYVFEQKLEIVLLSNDTLTFVTHFDHQVYKWWLDDMYLNNMLPLPISSSPGWVFPKQNFECIEDMLKYTTKMIFGWMQFKQQLEK